MLIGLAADIAGQAPNRFALSELLGGAGRGRLIDVAWRCLLQTSSGVGFRALWMSGLDQQPPNKP